MIELWSSGGGLPISALPPSNFVETGPYAWVRHPIYLGFNLVIFGVGLGQGSRGLAWIVSPAFLALWVVYSLIEEHFLARRFPNTYIGYRRRVKLWPRLRLYGPLRVALTLGFFKVIVEDGYRIPREGGVVLVGNHNCYLDPIYVGAHTRRNAMYLATAEAFRSPVLRVFLRFFDVIQVRRYLPDGIACRRMLNHLRDGGVVALFPEGERSPLGRLQPPLADVVRILSRLPYPVVPVGISGAFDVGPRWSGVLRLRPVKVQVGPPIQFDGSDPIIVLETSLRSRLLNDPQPVHLEGLPRSSIGRVLWRCPKCGTIPGWHPSALTCNRCGDTWKPTPDGFFRNSKQDARVTLAELAQPVWDHPEEEELTATVSVWRESSTQGPARRLCHVGNGELRLSRSGLSFQNRHLPIHSLRSCTTERADTLQIATTDQMWQFRPEDESVFRLWGAMTRWMSEASLQNQSRRATNRVSIF